MQTILPPPLKPGDTIGFFSPSAPATVFAPERFERAKAYLQGKGFKLVAGSLTGKSDHYRSGSIEERVEELNTLIRTPEVRCIMSTIGGMNSNSLLPYLDYEALKKDPKIIIGYSDVTALLLGIYAKTGLITFYGPALVASFGEFPPLVDQTFESFSALTCTANQSRYQYTQPEYWTDIFIDWNSQDSAKPVYPNHCEFLGSGTVTGRLIGGNQNTMMAIWGTPYQPEIKQGDILLLEDSMHDIATIERTTAQLKLAGVFERISAIILGKHELFKDSGTLRKPIDVLQEVLHDTRLPIVNGFDSCHTHPMLTMPLGSKVTIDFDKETVCLAEPWLS